MTTDTNDGDMLGLRRISALHWFVPDLKRHRELLADTFCFSEVAMSGAELERRTGQRSSLFRAGGCDIVCAEPIESRSASGRFLRCHPDGIGAVSIEVDNVDRAFSLIEQRGGTMIDDVLTVEDQHGVQRAFEIATPFGDVQLQLVESRGSTVSLPGFVPHVSTSSHNPCGFESYDHVTMNLTTYAPAMWWLGSLFGMRELWGLRIHTADGAPRDSRGSGFRTIVMCDPHSDVKINLNEPLRPYFEASQTFQFCSQHRGAGIQHAAIAVENMVRAVSTLRRRGVGFLPTPARYYQQLPARLQALGLEIDEDLRELQELGILVDGEGPGKYLLQIFAASAQAMEDGPNASPFFFELIQRKGDLRFGDGNARALFEAIEATERRL
jgi:4-hydroxyphenylpyruvate dioxygenase